MLWKSRFPFGWALPLLTLIGSLTSLSTMMNGSRRVRLSILIKPISARRSMLSDSKYAINNSNNVQNTNKKDKQIQQLQCNRFLYLPELFLCVCVSNPAYPLYSNLLSKQGHQITFHYSFHFFPYSIILYLNLDTFFSYYSSSGITSFFWEGLTLSMMFSFRFTYWF